MGDRKADDVFAQVRRICAVAVASGVVPGGVLLCAKGDSLRFFQAFGARQTDPEILPATTDTVYDVASITKAVITSVLTMQAVAHHTLALEDPVGRYHRWFFW